MQKLSNDSLQQWKTRDNTRKRSLFYDVILPEPLMKFSGRGKGCKKQETASSQMKMMTAVADSEILMFLISVSFPLYPYYKLNGRERNSFRMSMLRIVFLTKGIPKVAGIE
ncbi:hypothetical protein CDAR_463481 [Caerostris darwini]|uniref:Uncharacterized protein n=1 Tax=Caerostris darwini TaxID=1538125 RepID=A0AAV4VUD1_9ARAC|nr:hypothetical protein CDAR_463481 [Caerostris darwini]